MGVPLSTPPLTHRLYVCAPEHRATRKYKTLPTLMYSYISKSGNRQNEKLFGNTTPGGQSVFTQSRVFSGFASVAITEYQGGKCFIFLLQYSTKKNKGKIFGKFSVLTLSYINSTQSQSAFRIYKCYVIISYLTILIPNKVIGYRAVLRIRIQIARKILKANLWLMYQLE